MIRRFLKKELIQHGIWLIILALLIWGLIVLVVVAKNVRGMGGGTISIVSNGFYFTIPLASMILAHLLIAIEYRNKSQLFLDGLPLPRWRMLTIKAALGMLGIIIYTWGGLGIGWLLAKGSETFSWNYLGICLACTGCWAMFSFAFFFLTAFLGRIRYAVFLAVGYGLLFLNHATQVPVTDFPPFHIMQKVGQERDVWPVASLLWTLLIIAVIMTVTMVIGLVREGNIAAMLGEKMSHRERVFMAGVLFAAFCALIFLDQPKAEPFAILGAVEEEWQGARVFLSPESDQTPIDLDVKLATQLARRAATARDWLGISKEEFPPIYVVERTDLENKQKIVPETVDGDPVVLVYAAYREKDFSDGTLFAATMSNLLKVYSLNRVSHEDRLWLLRGLARRWEAEHADPSTLAENRNKAFAAVKEHGLEVDDLLGWKQYQQDVGIVESDAVVWVGLQLLEEQIGEPALRSLVQDSLVFRVKREDSRATWWDMVNPITKDFEQHSGIDLGDFVEQWRAHLLAAEKQEGVEEEA